MNTVDRRRVLGSGETTRIEKLRMDSGDLIVVVDDDEPTLQRVRQLGGLTACEVCEPRDLAELEAVLGVRRRAVVLVALDTRIANAIDILRTLSPVNPPPPVVLVGHADARLLGGARRLAAGLGVRIVGVLPRGFDLDGAHELCLPHVKTTPAVPREELERALAENELCLLYQPKLVITAAGLRIVAVEAFVRWQHPSRGLLRPSQFLSSLEREDLLTALTDFVMTESIRQVGSWRARGLTLGVSINLSPRLVRDRDFPDRLARLLREYDVPAELVSIDVTEANEGDPMLVLDVFTRLRLMRIGLSLDNFGTGQSSLTELCRLPFTEVKIDGSLIREVPFEREGSIIVRAIVELAHTLGLRACAEGVESQDTVEYLRDVGCDFLQGRVVCGPSRAAEIERIAGSLGLAADSAAPYAPRGDGEQACGAIVQVRARPEPVSNLRDRRVRPAPVG